jgi:MFS family permease
LVASALGSLASGNWKGRQETLIAGSALIVAALAAGMSPLLHLVTDRLLAQPMILRIMITIAIVAPPGFFMGIPFPTGLAHIKRLVPAFVPWAWGLNATASVSATILALLIALLMGLNAVFLTAALLYAVAAALFVLITRPKQNGERSPHR